MRLEKSLEELHKWYHTIHADQDLASIPIITDIEEKLKLTFVPASFDSTDSSSCNVCLAGSPEVRDDYKDTFTPKDLLNYIIAILHSSTYREKYREHFGIDFFPMPYPKNIQGFWSLVNLGGQLQQLSQSETHRLKQEIDVIEIV